MKIIVIPSSIPLEIDQIIQSCFCIDNSLQEYPWSIDAWRSLGENYLLFVLANKRDDNEDIEIKAFSLYMLDDTKECAHLLKIAVAASYQSTGLSKILFQDGLNYFMTNGYQSVFLEVRSRNEVAQNLYKKYGFEVIHRKKNYYSDGQDAVIYIKKLLSSV